MENDRAGRKCVSETAESQDMAIQALEEVQREYERVERVYWLW